MMKWPGVVLLTCLPLGVSAGATDGRATQPPPAYQVAAHQAGVPATLLYAIALQESGLTRQGRRVPWPWTLNVAGEARRFVNRRSACQNLQQALAVRRDRHIDIGLGQINLHYHGERVEHPCDLLDPYRNLTIAARILREQYRPGEDWLAAAGRYHRPAGGDPAARYQQQVQRHLVSLSSSSRP